MGGMASLLSFAGGYGVEPYCNPGLIPDREAFDALVRYAPRCATIRVLPPPFRSSVQIFPGRVHPVSLGVQFY